MARQAKIDFDDTYDLRHASDDVLDMYGEYLLRRNEEAEMRNRVVAAMKTVSTFSGLIGRKMSLTSAKAAYTDGVEIGAPFDHEMLYEFVEHEISHNLFKSNFEAKKLFGEQYVLQVAKALHAFGVTMDDKSKDQLQTLVGTILNIIEDHRVNSLWAMLYPGSYKRLLDYSQSLVEKKKKHAHQDIISFFLCVAYAAKVPSGPFDRYAPAMVTALKKVERKGPGATFVIGKWLMTQIVSEIIRVQKGMPPPPTAGKSTVKTDIDDLGGSVLRPHQSGANDDDGEGDDGDGDGEGSDADGDGDSDGQDGDSAQSGQGDAQGSGDGGQSGGAQDDWTPPPVNATAEERIDAFKQLMDAAAKMAGVNTPMAGALSRVNSEKQPHHSVASVTEARQQVAAAYGTDVTDEKALGDYLKKSADDMEKVIQQIEDALEKERKQSEKDWCGRNVHGKLMFKDVKSAKYTPHPLSSDDRRAIGRMREVFQRVKSRAAKTLAEDGVEVDIPAIIQRRASDQPIPFFKADVPGRGFKALVLVDRSSSMDGERSQATERATRILRAALKQPNVHFHVWGFHGNGQGCVLTRVAPNIEIADSMEMPASGNTPMTAAVRAAVNFLTEGTEKKQLIILTDGEPNTDSGDVLDGGKNRFASVRREVQRARRMGVNVTTLVIGGAVSGPDANAMFGDARQWTRVKDGLSQGAALTKALVQVVSTSFSRYLQGG